MPRVSPATDRPGWWYGLRAFVFFLAGGGLGFFAYAVISDRPDGPPWGWLLAGAAVCGVTGAVKRPRGHGGKPFDVPPPDLRTSRHERHGEPS
jgi:hypothetical protein